MTARNNIAKDMITVAKVISADSNFCVGCDADVEILFYKIFKNKVMQHTCNFEILIVQDGQSLVSTVSMSNIYPWRNTFPASLKKYAEYALSFKRLDVGINTIKVVDKDGKEFMTMIVYMREGLPVNLVLSPMLKAKLGFRISEFTVQIYDNFGNNVRKSVIVIISCAVCH